MRVFPVPAALLHEWYVDAVRDAGGRPVLLPPAPSCSRIPPAPGSLVPTGWTPDGLVEVLEAAESRFTVGVQWHPEHPDRRNLEIPLFGALIAATSDRQPSRRLLVRPAPEYATRARVKESPCR